LARLARVTVSRGFCVTSSTVPHPLSGFLLMSWECLHRIRFAERTTSRPHGVMCDGRSHPRRARVAQIGIENRIRFLQVGSLPDPKAHRPCFSAMGPSEVQVPTTPSATITALARPHCATTATSVCSLGPPPGTRRLNNGSRMRGDSHVRFCDGPIAIDRHGGGSF
jgi:hypothetical protein